MQTHDPLIIIGQFVGLGLRFGVAVVFRSAGCRSLCHRPRGAGSFCRFNCAAHSN